jgi:hypothetical protein
MSELKLNELNFSVSELRNLFENAPRNDVKFDACCKYFHDRVFYTESGFVYYYRDGKLIFKDRNDFDTTFLTGFVDGKLMKVIKQSSPDPYDMVLEEGEFIIKRQEGNKRGKINSLAQMSISQIMTKKIKVGKTGKEYVEHFKKYVDEVLANGNKKLFDIIMKWCARTVRRQKCFIALVLIGSTEGTGKSTLVKILEKILGFENVCNPNDKQLLNFNFEAYGKCLLCFEETQGVRDNKVFDVLKNMTTNDRYNFEKKFKDAGTLTNISNIFISSNFPVSFSGRRACQFTPTSKWFRQQDLFKKLYNADDECLKALYEYFLSFDVSNWGSSEQQEDVYQLNEGGNLKEIERMNNAWRFMKEQFALDKLSQKIKKTELYDIYQQIYGPKAMQKATFYDKVKELNVGEVKNSVDYFVIDGEDLYKQFEIRNLIHDEYKEVKIDSKFETEKENIELKKQIEALTKQIEELKTQQVKKEIKPEIKPEIKEEIKPEIKEEIKTEVKEGIRKISLKVRTN